MTAAYLAATGRQDRLAAFGLGRDRDRQRARRHRVRAVTDRRLAAAAKAQSRRRGYLDGRALAEVFAWLRPGDLVWNYWVNNYLLGKKPPAFDILFWNADTTRMAAGLHADFVDLAMDNLLVDAGAITVLGVPIDLSRIDTDAYVVAGIADHITPWQNCYRTHATARRHDAIRALDERAHRRAGQPARQPQGELPGEQGQSRRPGRTGSRAPRRSRAPGGPTPPAWLAERCGALAARAGAARRRRPAAARRRTRHLRLRQLRSSAVYETIGRSQGTDYFRIADQLTAEELDYLRRTRDFVDDEVLPVINDYWERAEFPSTTDRARWPSSASSATASAATAARR